MSAAARAHADSLADRARAVRLEDEIARRGIKLKREGKELIGKCPRCGGNNRFSIHLEKNVWNCRKCKTDKDRGDVIGFVQWMDDCDFRTARNRLANEPQPRLANEPQQSSKDQNAEARKVKVAEFEYLDEGGAVAFVVERHEFKKPDGSFVLKNDGKHEKKFSQRRPDPRGKDGWIWNVNGAPVVPYRLPELIEAVANKGTIFIVEGEAKADLMWNWNVPATCCAGGAEKWCDKHSEFLRGADVVILPDNDQPGRQHLGVVGASLQGVATSIRTLDLPNLPPKGDILDWAKQGGTVEQLHDLIAREAKPWSQQEAAGEQPKNLLQSSSEFTGAFTPPDFLVESILCRRYIYALTGHPGRGNTAVALLLAGLVNGGRRLGNLEVDKGRVLILAGENPTDTKMRWIALAQQMDFDVETADVHFIEGTFKISEKLNAIHREVEALGGVDFVIVDSSAAFFEGDEENNNTQQGTHARLLRELTTLRGGPCVLVLCHPPKGAGEENLQPRGGGAFLAEVDGNPTLTKNDMTVTLHWQSKLRGPDFLPINFLLKDVTHERLKDSKGGLLSTVVASHLSDAAQEDMATAARAAEDELLHAVAKNPRASVADLAKQLNWVTSKGEPQKSKVHRAIKQLERAKLLSRERDGLTVTEKGKRVLGGK
jgi:AAA domain/CHC2 zinc finger